MATLTAKPALAIFGVVLVTGAVLWNASLAPKDEAEPAAKAIEAAPRALDQAEKAKMAADIKGTLAKGKPAEGGVEGIPDVPIIVLPTIQSFKPQPSDSNIATHWYRPESRSAMVAEKGG